MQKKKTGLLGAAVIALSLAGTSAFGIQSNHKILIFNDTPKPLELFADSGCQNVAKTIAPSGELNWGLAGLKDVYIKTSEGQCLALILPPVNLASDGDKQALKIPASKLLLESHWLEK